MARLGVNCMKIKSIKKLQNGVDIAMIFIALGQKIKKGKNEIHG